MVCLPNQRFIELKLALKVCLRNQDERGRDTTMALNSEDLPSGSFAVLGPLQPNDPVELGDYKVSQALKTKSRKFRNFGCHKQSQLADRLTPDCDIAFNYYLFGWGAR
jgi:hypothetical protein